MRGVAIMRAWGYPVVLDCTHALQLPGGEGTQSGGQPQFIETLARAGVAAGADGIFMEVHDRPEKALSDGSSALKLQSFAPLVRRLCDLGKFVRRMR
jgi:2-dehydro-3-deoxyphosphooctonate aldolase (KDO 8-P synthase)